MWSSRLIRILFAIGMIAHIHADERQLLDAMQYMVYSDTSGLWLIYPNQEPELLYALPTGFEIDDIVLNPQNDEIVFAESQLVMKTVGVSKRGQPIHRAWTFRNLRTITKIASKDRTFKFDTIASDVLKRPVDYPGPPYNKLMISPSGEWLVGELRTVDIIRYELYRRESDDGWSCLKSINQWDWQLPLGWGKGESQLFILSLSGDTKWGLSIVDLATGESSFEDQLAVGTISGDHNLLMTFPLSYGDGMIQQIEFYNLIPPRKIIKNINVRINGSLDRESIAWNPTQSQVACPFEVQGYSGHSTELVFMSPIDALNQRISLPSVINDLAWTPDGKYLVYLLEGELYYLEQGSSESHRVEFPIPVTLITQFGVKWMNDVQ